MQDEKITVKSDSQLVVKQMCGSWKCRGGLYAAKYYEAIELAKQFKNIRYMWIPREQNLEADAQSRMAYEDYCKEKGMVVKYRV